MLRCSPRIEDRNLMHARYCAMRRAGLLGIEFAPQIGNGIFFEGNPRISALLRTIMHQAIFADVQIASTRAASPLVRTALGNVVLEGIDAGEAAPFELLHLVVDRAFIVFQRLQLPLAVVDNSNR